MADDQVPKAIVRGVLPPYAPAAGELPADAVVIPTYRLYSSGQMALATFFGSPIAGLWLLSRNYKRLGNPTAQWLSMFGGLGWTLLLLAVALVIPNFNVLSLISIGLVAGLANITQGTALFHHYRLGGRRGSWGITVAAGLVSLVIVVGAVFGGAVAYYVLTESPRVEFGDSDVIYERDGTEAQARAVGAALRELEYFSDTQAATVIVHRDANRAVVSFYVQDMVFHDPTMPEGYANLASTLSTKAFAGEPVDIWLLDSDKTTRVKLPWEKRAMAIPFGKDEVVFQSGASEAEAREVGRVLGELGYFLDAGRSVTIRRSGRVMVSFNADSSDDSVRTVLHALAYPLSKGAFGGAAVDLTIVDAGGGELARLTWETRPADPIDLGDGRVIGYRDGGTIEEARAIASVVNAVRAPHMAVYRDDDRAIVELTIAPDKQLHGLLDDLSAKAFDGKPVDIRFVDDSGEALGALTWETRPKHKRR